MAFTLQFRPILETILLFTLNKKSEVDVVLVKKPIMSDAFVRQKYLFAKKVVMKMKSAKGMLVIDMGIAKLQRHHSVQIMFIARNTALVKGTNFQPMNNVVHLI